MKGCKTIMGNSSDKKLRDMSPEERAKYKGVYVQPLETRKQRKKRFKHPIFLFTDKMKDDEFVLLEQIVNVYQHSIEDFEFNVEKITQHFKRYIGDAPVSMFMLGQSIRFRVKKDQEPFELSLYSFFLNYTILAIPILMGADMSDWKPFTPRTFTPEIWVDQINKEIVRCRSLGNMRELCEYIQVAKFSLTHMAVNVGDRLGLSISNNEFIEVAKRSDEARKSITCTFDIDDDITPSGLETLTKKRASDLLTFISKQTDLSISTYTKNGLFNTGQFREFAVHIGHKPDLSGNTIPFTSKTNILMGIKDELAYMIDAHGGRKAELIKLKVAKAGALERSLSMLLSPVKWVDTDYECDSKHLRERHIETYEDLKNLDGRVATFDVKSDDYFIIDPYNDEFHLIGKTVYLKTPITCTHPRRSEGIICSACYGKNLSNLNCDVHLGRMSALNSADDIEQGLLSAKHALLTDTDEINFSEHFESYFEMGTCQIKFNDLMIEASKNRDDDFNHLYLVFNPDEMEKHKDGENRHYDRSFKEIVIYDSQDESRISITEKNGSLIYLSPEFNEYFFLDTLKQADGEVMIPFTDLIETGKPTCDVLFEYQFKNNELADALVKLEMILGKEGNIGSYTNFTECLDSIIPLFKKGGIKLPEIHFEMIISQLIFNMDNKPVDWTEENPEYKFFSINKAILSNPSVVTSMLYREASKQIAGNYGTYSKTGTSDYDEFLFDDGKSLEDFCDDEELKEKLLKVLDDNEVDDE